MTKPRDDTAATSPDLTNDQKAVLAFLGQDAGGYTAGNIARVCEQERNGNIPEDRAIADGRRQLAEVHGQ